MIRRWRYTGVMLAGAIAWGGAERLAAQESIWTGDPKGGVHIAFNAGEPLGSFQSFSRTSFGLDAPGDILPERAGRQQFAT